MPPECVCFMLIHRNTQTGVLAAVPAATVALLAGGKLLGQGVSDEEWRQQVAVGRKRSRASGEDLPAPAAAAAPLATTNNASAPADQSPGAPPVQSPGTRPSRPAHPAPPAGDSHSLPPAEAEAEAEHSAGCAANTTGLRGAQAAEAAADVGAARGGGEGGREIKGRRGAMGEGAVKRRKQGAARAREVQELLDSVGGSTDRGGRGGTVVIGGRRGCDGLTEDVRDEIRRNLGAAAKAEKAVRVEVRCRQAGALGTGHPCMMAACSGGEGGCGSL